MHNKGLGLVSGSTFRKQYSPGDVSKGVTANVRQQLDEAAEGALTEGRLCAGSLWGLTQGSESFQMDFLSFIFLSKGLIPFRSPDCMGIMGLFYAYQYNAQ